MRKTSSYFALLLSIMLVFSSFSIVFAEPEQTDGVFEPAVVSVFNYTEPEDGKEAPEVPVLKLEEVVEKVVAEDGTESENKRSVFKQDDKELFGYDSPEYKAFMDAAKASLRADAIKGLELCMTEKVTMGHIRLDTWGSFFNKYLNKVETAFPSASSIDIKFEGYYVKLADTKAARSYIRNVFIPDLLPALEEVCQLYPMHKFALKFDSGCLLKDYKFDINNIRLVDTLYPLDGLESSNYTVLDKGSYFGFTLGLDYVDVLRGYIEGNEVGTDKSITLGDKKGSVDVLSPIVLLKSVDKPISEMTLADFKIYSNLAVRLDTKKLIDTSDMTTSDKEVLYNDFKLVEDILILAPISDTAVIVQPTYLECFEYGGWDKNFGRKVDFTEYISSDAKEVSVVGSDDKIPVEYFADKVKMLDTRLGNAPFLVYYSSHTPYDLLVKWAYDNSIMTDSEQSAFLKQIKSDLTKEGRKADYDKYLKASGQMTSNNKLILFAVVLFVIVIAFVIFLIVSNSKKKKTAAQIQQGRKPMFEDDDDDMPMNNGMNNGMGFNAFDDDDDDNDDNDGGFDFM